MDGARSPLQTWPVQPTPPNRTRRAKRMEFTTTADGGLWDCPPRVRDGELRESAPPQYGARAGSGRAWRGQEELRCSPHVSGCAPPGQEGVRVDLAAAWPPPDPRPSGASLAGREALRQRQGSSASDVGVASPGHRRQVQSSTPYLSRFCGPALSTTDLYYSLFLCGGHRPWARSGGGGSVCAFPWRQVTIVCA